MRRVALWIVLAVSASCQREERCVAPRTHVGDAILQAEPDVDRAATRLSHAESEADVARDRLQWWHESVLDVRTALGCTGKETRTCCEEIVAWFRAQPSPVSRDEVPVYANAAATALVRGAAPASSAAAHAVQDSLHHLDDLLLAGSRPAGAVEDVAKTCTAATAGLDALFDDGQHAWQDEVALADRNVAASKRDYEAARARVDLLERQGRILEHACR